MARPALLLGGLLIAAAALPMVPAHLADLAPSGRSAGGFVALAALACAVGGPRQAAAFAGGYAFGFCYGAALAWVATGLACAGDFFWAREVGRGWARRRLRGRLARADRFIAAHPFSATLALRLLPVGNNLALNLVAGVSAVRALPFLAASLLGYLPQTAIFALLGQGVHVGRAAQIAAGTAMFAASGAIGAALLGRWRRFAEPPAGAGEAALSAGAGTRSGGAIPLA
jgi:uncharacterized membrane protein YdjX (TVP38/TMEM64 family)